MKTKTFISVILLGFLLVSATTKKKHSLFKSDALKDFVEIKEGNMSIDSEQFQVKEFLIAKHEVTNQEYQEFLQNLKERGNNEALLVAQIKSTNWQKINVERTIEEKYHTYKGFANFPVVNITYEGAQLYCHWLTEKVNQEISEKYTVEFRLPTRKEWIRAARGETKNTYAWHSPYLRNATGNFLCNFKRLGLESIHFNEKTNAYEIVKLYDGPDFTVQCKVNSYEPNEFGIYNMCGNVAEMTAEKGIAVGGNFNSPGYDVRVESKEVYSDASPLVGFRPIMAINNK